jgi:hypothetical protein
MSTLQPRLSEHSAASVRRFYLRLGLGAALIYLAFVPPGIYSIDGNSMLAVAESIVARHSLAVDPSLGSPGLHQQFYSLWYPLQSALAVPFVAVAFVVAHLSHLPFHYCAAVFGLALEALIMAATVVAVGGLAMHLGADPADARFAALVFGFGTIAPAYARSFLAEPLLALVTALAMWLAFAGRPVNAGVAGMLAVLAKPPGIIVGPILSLYTRARNKAWLWVAPAAGTAVGVVAYCAYNDVRFGRFLFLAAHPAGAEMRLAAAPAGMVGLLLSPDFGLLWFCPVVVAAIAGLVVGAKKRLEETAATAAVCLGYLAVYGSWSAWQGGWSWGPRFLLPVLPILIPFVALLSGRWRRAALWLALAGFLVSAPTWICFYERAFAERPQAQQGWSVSDSPLVRVWPAALHELQDAYRTDPRMLISQAEKTHSPSHTVETSRALRVVALWWWLLPAANVPRWIGATFSFVLAAVGVFLLRISALPPPA